MNWKFWQRSEPQANVGRRLWTSIESGGGSYLSGSNIGSPRGNGAVVACVQRIVSRAIEIPFMAESDSAQRVLDAPSWMKSVDSVKMWRRLYECVLYEGNGAVMRTAGGLLRVGQVDGDAIITRMETGQDRIARDFRTKAIGDVETETVRVQEPDVCRINWAEDCTRPWDVVRKEAMAYAELMDDMYQAAHHGKKVVGMVKQTEVFQDANRADESLKQFREQLQSSRKYMTGALEKGLDYSTVPLPSIEGSDAAEALAAVARVYGVPLMLLQAGAWRMNIDQADAHLLRDAVIPLVSSVASGLTKIFGEKVKPDMRAVGLPSRSGTPGVMMTLSQTGVMTINEIREQVGLPPMEDGDVLPQTAGAAERPGGSQDERDEDEESEDETE